MPSPGLHNRLRYTDLQVGVMKAMNADQGEVQLERVGETMQPVMDVWSRPEWARLIGHELRTTATDIAAGGAGTFAEFQVVNPAGSGILVIVERIIATTRTDLSVELDLANILATGDLGFSPRDTRLPGSSIIRRRTGNAGVVDVAPRWFALANVETSVSFVLRPGTLLRCQAGSTNTALSIAVAARTRHCTKMDLDPT